MNSLNATYDINWGVADGNGLQCQLNRTDGQPLPVCVNTSFPGYAGTWTMYPGLQAATHYNQDDFGKYRYPSSTWTLEIAFPIKATVVHGGLLSADQDTSYAAYDPNKGGTVAGKMPRYWFVDFARAEHPRIYTIDQQQAQVQAQAKGQLQVEEQYCPFNCTASLATAATNLSTNPSSAQCAEVKAVYVKPRTHTLNGLPF